MKKVTLFLALFVAVIPMLNAQWVSPGNGTTYTFPDLVEVTDGTVTNGLDGFLINADLTISENDILKIDNQVMRIDAAEVLITIHGSMVCSNANRVRRSISACVSRMPRIVTSKTCIYPMALASKSSSRR